MAGRSRRRDGRATSRRTGRPPLLVATLGAALAIAGIAAGVARGTPSGRTTAAEVEAYQASIAEPLRHWGKIEALGMRPAVADLRAGQGVPPSWIAGEARAWRSGLAQVRAQLDAAVAPPPLRRAADLLDQSVRMYLGAATLFEQAASVPRAEAPPLIRRGVDQAAQADCLFDTAAVQIQDARRAAGLDTDPGLPDQPCSR